MTMAMVAATNTDFSVFMVTDASILFQTEKRSVKTTWNPRSGPAQPSPSGHCGDQAFQTESVRPRHTDVW